MATVAVVHGAGDTGWAWHRVVDELQRRGHVAVAPDLPVEDDDAGLGDYAETVGEALRGVEVRRPLVVVGHSLGAFAAPLVAEREGADLLVLAAPLIPRPGEAATGWSASSGYAGFDRGTAADDPFYNDVPRHLAGESQRRSRTQALGVMDDPLPLAAWPAVETRVLLFRDDLFLPAAFVRQLALERLGVVAEELPGGYCAPLSHPVEIADALLRDLGRGDFTGR